LLPSPGAVPKDSLRCRRPEGIESATPLDGPVCDAIIVDAKKASPLPSVPNVSPPKLLATPSTELDFGGCTELGTEDCTLKSVTEGVGVARLGVC